jgi:hypothetical protein
MNAINRSFVRRVRQGDKKTFCQLCRNQQQAHIQEVGGREHLTTPPDAFPTPDFGFTSRGGRGFRDKTVGSRPDRRLTFCPDGNKKSAKSAWHLRWAWLGGLVQLIAEVLSIGRCCLVPQLRSQVAGFPFAGDPANILSLSLQVLLEHQQPLNKMLAATTVMALPPAGASGGRAAAPDVSASKGNYFLSVTTHADRRSSAFLPTL